MHQRTLTAVGLVALLCACGGEPPPEVDNGDAAVPATRVGERIDFLERSTIGDPPPETPPWIANLAIVDLDGDGLLDVVACDVTKNEIAWIRQGAGGELHRERPQRARGRSRARDPRRRGFGR